MTDVIGGVSHTHQVPELGRGGGVEEVKRGYVEVVMGGICDERQGAMEEWMKDGEWGIWEWLGQKSLIAVGGNGK